MKIYEGYLRVLGLLPLPSRLRSSTIKSKLYFTLMPALVLLLTITGYLTYRFSADYIAIALQRNVKVQNLGQCAAIETFLETCKQDLLFMASGMVDAPALRDFLSRSSSTGKTEYSFLGYISVIDDAHLFFVQHKGQIRQLPSTALDSLLPEPLAAYEHVKPLDQGTVWLSGVMKASYPFPLPENANNRLKTHVLQFATPVMLNASTMRGYLLLNVPAKNIRNILSLYNSNHSPLWAYARSPEVRFSYMFNLEGWVLFQSESYEKPDVELSTYLLRSGCEGSMGMPSLDSAFRPNPSCIYYWKIVNEIREGKQGIIPVNERIEDEFFEKEHSVAYTPIWFSPGPGAPRHVYAGVAFDDRSRLTMVAGYKHVDVMFIITLAAVIIGAFVIYVLGYLVTRPLLELTKAVQEIKRTGCLEPINIPSPGYETALLQTSINNMLQTMSHQMDEIRIRDMRIESVNLREKVDVDEGYLELANSMGPNQFPEILGFGHRLDSLREEINKAAKVEVDVLIVGETGTGKQLIAEAVHSRGTRASNPLISINCGELDENLLMDTLFGHVKGAFTEAKTDRKGAFLEAQGGTLFLDEIQLASPRVQQALLRAIALRKIKPLGSDRDVDVDVRVIAATNVDLRHLIEAKVFREDLYFRLKVITIHTPPLREHKENILLLAMHFMREAEALAGKQNMALSKGALERMKLYNWPGNVRELRNCVTRAVVMAEDEVILVDDLLLEGLTPHLAENGAQDPNVSEQPGKVGKGFASRSQDHAGDITKEPPLRSRPSDTPLPQGVKDVEVQLNSRQKKAWPLILQRESITRNDYQALIEGDISARTAIYDLQDFVKKGLLRKKGHGPATRYTIIERQ